MTLLTILVHPFFLRSLLTRRSENLNFHKQYPLRITLEYCQTTPTPKFHAKSHISNMAKTFLELVKIYTILPWSAPPRNICPPSPHPLSQSCATSTLPTWVHSLLKYNPSDIVWSIGVLYYCTQYCFESSIERGSNALMLKTMSIHCNAIMQSSNIFLDKNEI